MEQRWESNTHVAPNCPRCASSNTKFCYYNNYSLSQPRYFCKGCRRYWTKGGSLRNVPVGGGCRRTRRTKQARSTSQTNRVGPSPGRSSTDPKNSGSSDIDMAAVFANFLNQSSNLENKGNSCDLINETGMPRVENGFSGHDPNVFELGTLLSDELPNFGWQPMVHLDEFGSFLAVDQSNSSTDLISDNWSSLDVDILGYENLI